MSGLIFDAFHFSVNAMAEARLDIRKWPKDEIVRLGKHFHLCTKFETKDKIETCPFCKNSQDTEYPLNQTIKHIENYLHGSADFDDVYDALVFAIECLHRPNDLER